MPVSELARRKVRARFAADQVDAVLIQRGGPGVLDETSLETTGMSDPVTVYTGPARLAKAAADAVVELGEGEVATRTMGCQVPFDAAQVFVEDVVSIQKAVDPKLVGTSWRVVGVDGGGSWNVLTTLTLSGWYPSSSYWDGTSP